MAGRFLGYDPALGLTEAFHIAPGQSSFAIETMQDVEPILENNKRRQNDGDGFTASREGRYIASIPLVIIEKWKNELGVDIFNKNHQPAIRRLLNDPDWRYLRTSLGRY